jgi:hypothetical protein
MLIGTYRNLIGTWGNLGTDGTLHRFIMFMLCLGPSESEKIISTGFRLTPYSLMIEVVTSGRSARDGEEIRPVSRRRPAWENGREDGRECLFSGS